MAADNYVLLVYYFLTFICWSTYAIDNGDDAFLPAKSQWQFDSIAKKKWLVQSKIGCIGGHYPPDYCTFSSAYLNHSDRYIYVNSQDALPNPSWSTVLWQTKIINTPTTINCNRMYDIGFMFTFFFYYGYCNNFHLHYDTLIPIYKELQRLEDEKQHPIDNQSVVLMPTVEKKRMEILDWETKAFTDTYANSIFTHALQALAGPHQILAMSLSLTKDSSEGFTCFRKLFLGSPNVDYNDKDFMRGYVAFMLKRLNISKTRPTKIRIGLIERKNRRRILNEDELLKAVSPIARIEMIKFDDMTFREQIKLMRKYTVLIGINGAGLINGLFLPNGGVNIQLVPYKAEVNYREFGSMLKARGPYLEWHNKHKNFSRVLAQDQYQSQADTIVKVDEFIELVKEALNLGLNAKLNKNYR